MQFPYGKAPLCLLIVALLAGGAFAFTQRSGNEQRADLVMATGAMTHYNSYLKVIPEFERQHNVKVDLQLVAPRALQSRLSAALNAGAEAPDVAEVYNMSFFLRGPLENVQLVDLTDRIRQEGIDEKMVKARFSLWSSRGRIFALPHDVHPVVMVYNREILEKEGIDPNSIRTWDDFIRVGKELTGDFDGDGVIDRYAIDMPAAGDQTFGLLMFQRNEGLFDEQGNVIFDTKGVADLICWYVRNMHGPDPPFFPLAMSRDGGRSQSLTKAIEDGFIVFLLAADWRTRLLQLDISKMSGKMGVMPLPVWEEGGNRTSTAGGTGLIITRRCKNVDLAWELAKFLYLNEDDLEERFGETNIIPPVISAWEKPMFDKPSPFYSNQPLGRILTQLGREVPTVYSSPYFYQAQSKMNDAIVSTALYYRAHGEQGLEEFAFSQLRRTADELRRVIAHNHFLQ